MAAEIDIDIDMVKTAYETLVGFPTYNPTYRLHHDDATSTSLSRRTDGTKTKTLHKTLHKTPASNTKKTKTKTTTLTAFADDDADTDDDHEDPDDDNGPQTTEEKS